MNFAQKVTLCVVVAAALEATVPKEENEAMDADAASKEDAVNETNTDDLDASTAADDPSQENGAGKCEKHCVGQRKTNQRFPAVLSNSLQSSCSVVDSKDFFLSL